MKHLIPHFQTGIKPKSPQQARETDRNGHALYRALEIDTLARTLWGEARGEGSAGMQAVACVIMNRVRHAQAHSAGFWWGNNVIQVCQKPYQFSCWNRNDPNFEKVQGVTDENLHFATARRIARRAVYNLLEDPTGGADHYHAAGITPYWTQGHRPVAVIGRHISTGSRGKHVGPVNPNRPAGIAFGYIRSAVRVAPSGRARRLRCSARSV